MVGEVVVRSWGGWVVEVSVTAEVLGTAVVEEVVKAEVEAVVGGFEVVGGWCTMAETGPPRIGQSAAQIKAHSVPSVHSSQASEINPNPNICIR